MELESLKLVALVSKHGSFAAAARVLDLDPSSVSRTISNVEAQLQLRLFQRSTRALSMTEEGATYLAQIIPLLEEFDRAHEMAQNASQQPSGALKLTASVSFSHRIILPQLKKFMDLYPEISIELLPTDTNLDLTAHNIDLAIRLAPAPTGDVISSKLMDTRYVVCASPAYVASNGPLARPEDLLKHDCLRLALPNFRTDWHFRKDGHAAFEVPVDGKLIIGNALSLRQAALDGLGPVLLADWLVGQDIKDGLLVQLFPEFECTATEFDTAAWALYPSRSYLPQKVRVMIDFLRENKI